MNRDKYQNNPPMPEVVIVPGRCSKDRQLFGMRFEKMNGVWVNTWAFSVREESADREGYHKNEIRGQFAFDSKYPGCPHCGDHDIVKCSCGKVACWDGESQIVTCPWCHAQGRIEGYADSLSAGGDI